MIVTVMLVGTYRAKEVQQWQAEVAQQGVFVCERLIPVVSKGSSCRSTKSIHHPFIPSFPHPMSSVTFPLAEPFFRDNIFFLAMCAPQGRHFSTFIPSDGPSSLCRLGKAAAAPSVMERSCSIHLPRQVIDVMAQNI